MDVLYLDNHLLAVDKPCGLLTQPSGTQQPSLEEEARLHLKNTYNKPGNVFLEAVHRIDKPTCGVVLFARTSKALSRLNESMRQNACTKIYRAILVQPPKAPQGTLRDFLVHDDFHAEVVPSGTPDARECVLDYRVLQMLPTGLALVEIQLHTGRYHQIRAQFAHRGCPVLGDTRYGAPSFERDTDAIALQHYQLVTPHPTKSETITLTSKQNLLKMAGI